MLKVVLRDGFTETERVVLAVQAGWDDVAARRTFSHAAVMNKAEAILSRRLQNPALAKQTGARVAELLAVAPVPTFEPGDGPALH